MVAIVAGVRGSAARLIAAVVALALPPRCPGCDTPVAHDHRFCAACWSSLHLIMPPWCAGCNRPFSYDYGHGARCAACIAQPPYHSGIRAGVAYGHVARRLALKLKYGGRIGIAATMAERIAPIVPEGLTLLVPVPLHRSRLWSRGFNQAGLIAAALHRRTGVPHDPFALARRRRTETLRGLGHRARRRAVAGAMVADPVAVRAQAIGLVDDVYTTGATADACARALLAAGALSVTVLCWARVLDEGDGDGRARDAD